MSAADIREDGVTLKAEDMKKNKDVSFDADVVLVAIGRRPRTEDMNLEQVGVKLNDRKQIEVRHPLV